MLGAGVLMKHDKPDEIYRFWAGARRKAGPK